MSAGIPRNRVASGGRSGARRRHLAGRGGVMSDINITPFVDVMLVLLIVFMVAAPLLTVGVPVELPKTAAGALAVEQEEPLTLTLTADGRLLVMTAQVTPDALLARLNAIVAERSSRKLFLRVDGAVPYEKVAQLMGALNSEGFNQIGLVTDPEGPGLGTNLPPAPSAGKAAERGG